MIKRYVCVGTPRSLLAGFGHSRMLGLGFPTLRKKEKAIQGSGGPAFWALVKQRWLVYVGY